MGNCFVSAIIAAGGSGTRIKSIDIPKQFFSLDDRTVLEHTVAVFEDCELIDEIIVITLPDYVTYCAEKLKEFKKIKKITVGGNTRQQSVFNGLKCVSEKCGLVVVHDGARPFVTSAEIKECISAANGCASLIGTRSSDTIKTVDNDNFVVLTADRAFLWAVKTPQVIPYDIFISAYEKADKDGFTATDDVSLVERIGYPVKIVEGSPKNIKITTDTDLQLAKLLLDDNLGC